MGAAITLYLPSLWDFTIPAVMETAGFEIVTKSRKFAMGKLGAEHLCKRDGKVISLTQIPLLDDPSFVFVLGIARTQDSEFLLEAQEALVNQGALDEAMFKRHGTAD